MSLNRRQFLGASALAAAASALDFRTLAAQVARPAPPPPPPPPAPEPVFTPLRGSVGIFTLLGGTIGWYITPNGVVVVDTQMGGSSKICLDGVLKRSGGRKIDYVINTHHHFDHTGGNGVFRPATAKIVAHANVPGLQKAAAARTTTPPAGAPSEEVYADTTFTTTWHAEVGGEGVSLKHYGPGHTGGDAVVTFEKANIVHVGDLVFNRRQPYIDRPAGASIANWIKGLDAVAADHGADTIFIFGHAGGKFPVTGGKADLAYQRDFLTALLDFVRGEMKAGKYKDMIVKITDPLKGFPDHGPLLERVLTPAYDELVG
jgi:cyclase